MASTLVTQSPQASLADLFLDNLQLTGSQLASSQRNLTMNKTFSQILDNNIKRFDQSQSWSRSATASSNSTFSAATQTASKSADDTPAKPIRRSAISELEDQANSLGVPLDQVSLRKEDLPKLKKVLEDSGYSEKEVNDIMGRLSEGSLSMDRIMTVIGRPKEAKTDSPVLTEESLPKLGQFLTDMGLGAEEVKSVLSTLQPGQKFGAAEFKELLLKNYPANLRGNTLAGVDKQNLKDLFTSMGIKSEDQGNFWNMMSKTGGRVSLEGLTAFFKSLDRPQALSSDQLQNVQDLLGNVQLDHTLRVTPYFNRIVTMLENMGDKNVNEQFLSENPAIQALRDGASQTRAVTQGANSSGQFGTQDQGMGDGLWGGTDRTSGAETAAKTTDTNFSSKLAVALAAEVSEKMTLQAKNNQNRLKLQLNPKELGRIDIRLVMKDNGLSASIVAENPMVKKALEDQMGDIREALAQQGLDLEKFDVSLGWGHGQDAEDDRGRNLGQARTEGEPETEGTEEITASGLDWGWNIGRVDRRV